MFAMALADLQEELISTQRKIDALQLKQSRRAAQFAAGDEWDDEGFASAIDWIRFNCHITSSVAANYVAVGKSELAETVREMGAGRLGFAHVVAMARTAQAVGRQFDEAALLPVALESSPGKFHHKCLHYRHSIDSTAYKEEQEQIAEGRSLHLSTAEDGSLLLSGVLDPVSGAELRQALEPLARPSGAHDDRTRDQRMADAFCEKVTGNRTVNLQVTATVQTLKDLAGAAAGEMDLSLPISAASVQRIAYDCSVTRVLLSQDSIAIDLGRSKRVVSAGLRSALKIRDGHCQWPRCERPASFCDGHHLVHWVNGGETNLGNLVLLCRRHHRMVHEGGWQLIKAEDQIVTIAPTVTFGLPRGPD